MSDAAYNYDVRIRLSIAGIAISLALFLGNEFYYPAEWTSFAPGLTREQILYITGAPTYDMGEIKGAFWQRNGFFTTHEMNIYFENNAAKWVLVERRIGTNRTFHRSIIYSTFPLE